MKNTKNLGLPIYDNPKSDLFKISDVNNAHAIIDETYETMKNAKDHIVEIDKNIPIKNADAEIIDARIGKSTLGEKIREIDSSLDNIKCKQFVTVQDFGGICDGVADDTSAFKEAINYVKKNKNKLVIIGMIRICDEILIDESVNIEGFCNSSVAQESNNKSQIIFDNNEVNSDGDAIKCAIRFKRITYYQNNSTKIKNIMFIAKQQIKNQHCIILDQTDFSNSNLDNLIFRNFTGYAIAINKKNGVSIEEGGYSQNINWSNLSFYNVGGCIGRIDGLNNLIFTLATLTNINLDNLINPISPQPVMYNFDGWRWGVFTNILAEGTLKDITDDLTAFKFNMNNIVNGMWIEFSGGVVPKYSVDFTSEGAILEINNVTGITNNSPILIGGEKTFLKIKNLDSYNCDISKSILYNSPNSFCEIDGLIVGLSKQISKSLLGRVSVKNVNNTYGGQSVKFNYSNTTTIYEYDGGLLENTQLVKFSPEDYQRTYEIRSDNDEGRCLVVKRPVGTSDGMAYFYVTINVPDEYVGCTVTAGIRGKIVTDDENSTVDLITTTDTSNGIVILGNSNEKNKFKEEFIIKQNVGKSFTFTCKRLNCTKQHELWISDIVINLSNELPVLKPGKIANLTTLKFNSNNILTKGDFIKGDIINNTNPTSGNYVGWVCIKDGTDNNAIFKGYGLIEN